MITKKESPTNSGLIKKEPPNIFQNEKWKVDKKSSIQPPWTQKMRRPKYNTFFKKVGFYIPVLMTVFLVGFLLLSYFFTFIWHLLATPEEDVNCMGVLWTTTGKSKALMKGKIYLGVIILLAAILIVSIVRSGITDPGLVPDEWDISIDSEFEAKKKEVMDRVMNPTFSQNKERMSQLSLDEEADVRSSYKNPLSREFPSDKAEEFDVLSLEEGPMTGEIDIYDVRRSETAVLARGSKFGMEKRICTRCIKAKPPRTHHCSVCNRCILKMDHHCPWIANCVGFCNYKYFILMLMYSGISSLFIVGTYWEEVYLVLYRDTFSYFYAYIVLVEFFLALTLGGLLTGFSIFHIWMTSNGLTTIEYCEKKGYEIGRKSKYDVGLYKNLQNVFGKNILVWLFPIYPNYDGKGLKFKSRRE